MSSIYSFIVSPTTVAAILMISLYSLMIKETIFSRWGEFIYVGMATSITFFTAYSALYSTTLIPLSQGQLAQLIPIVLGFIILLRPFFKSLKNIALWPLAIFTGFTLGSNIAGLIYSQVWSQVIAVAEINTSSLTSLSISIIYAIVVVFVVLSFTTTVTHKGSFGRVAQIGRILFILCLGLAFGDYIMARVALVLSRVQYLIYNWLGIPPLT